MPFRARNKYRCAGAFETFSVQLNPTESGVFERTLVSNNVSLPDAGLMDLELMLKAGVDLKRVNTRVIPSSAESVVETLKSVVESKKSDSEVISNED